METISQVGTAHQGRGSTQKEESTPDPEPALLNSTRNPEFRTVLTDGQLYFLSPNALKLYTCLELRGAPEIRTSYADLGNATRIRRTTLYRALDELKQKGFIQVQDTREGGHVSGICIRVFAVPKYLGQDAYEAERARLVKRKETLTVRARAIEEDMQIAVQDLHRLELAAGPSVAAPDGEPEGHETAGSCQVDRSESNPAGDQTNVPWTPMGNPNGHERAVLLRATVDIGARVRLRLLTRHDEAFDPPEEIEALVVDEQDPDVRDQIRTREAISIRSPLGQAIRGAQEGDTRKFVARGNSAEVTVLAVTSPGFCAA